MTSYTSKPAKKKEKSKNNQWTPLHNRLISAYSLKVCLFSHIPHFGNKNSDFFFFFFAAHWRKWRDSALRHREGHIHAGGKCCLCSAQPVRYPKISTPAAPREHRHNHGRFVQRCRDTYQRNLDRAAGREPAVGSLDGKTAAFALICLETNTGKCCASAPLRWRSDPNPLCYRKNEFSD